MFKLMNRSVNWSHFRTIYIVAVVTAGIAQVAVAQQSRPPAASTESPAKVTLGVPSKNTTLSTNSTAEDQYRIGPGDILDIRFYNRPQLSGTLRVGMSGKIQMPLIENEIQAACRTESELAKDIATVYLKYQRNPYVDVTVKEYASTPVAVVGAVDKPGRFQLTRRIRLLELLAFAGGPTDKAGGQIVVAHTGGFAMCGEPAKQDTKVETASSEGFIYYNLKDTLRGDERANPWVEPGDMVSITESDQAYVVGNVFKPQPVALKEQVTVSQAIAMAGGTLPSTKSNQIRVFRKIPGTTGQKLIIVDLGAIKQRKAEDIALQANDIVDVPTSTGKKVMSSILTGLSGGMSSIPYIITRQ
jgi:polysaccharide export outer membrane protein